MSGTDNEITRTGQQGEVRETDKGRTGQDALKGKDMTYKGKARHKRKWKERAMPCNDRK